jgi:hypothetical protein
VSSSLGIWFGILCPFASALSISYANVKNRLSFNNCNHILEALFSNVEECSIWGQLYDLEQVIWALSALISHL